LNSLQPLLNCIRISSEDIGELFQKTKAIPDPIDPKWLNDLYQVSKGDPFYLNYLIDDINQGLFTVNKITEQPKSLNAYLNDWFKQLYKSLSQDVNVESSIKKIIGILTIALGPITRDDILGIYPEIEWDFEDSISKIDRWIYCDISNDNVQYYSLCHPRFREYMISKIRNQLSMYCEKLIDYCSTWNELNSNYISLHFIRHLVEESNLSEVKKTVLNYNNFSNKYEWFEYQYRQGGSNLRFFDDLDLLMKCANQHKDITTLIHCLMIKYSLRDFRREIHPKLIFEMIRSGTSIEKWSLEEGIQTIKLLDEWNQAKTICMLSEDVNIVSTSYLVDLSCSLKKEWPKAEALYTISRHRSDINLALFLKSVNMTLNPWLMSSIK